MQGARLFGRVPVAWWEGMRDCNSSVTPSSRLDNKAYPRTYITFTQTANRCCIQLCNVKHLASTPPPACRGPSPRDISWRSVGRGERNLGKGKGSLHPHARNAVFPDLPQPSLPPPIFLARLCMFRGCLSGDFRYLQTQRRLASRSCVSFDVRYRISTHPGVTIFGLGLAGCHCFPTTGDIQAVPRP